LRGLGSRIGLEVRVNMIMLGDIRALFRMILPFRDQRRVHAAVLALLYAAIGLPNDVALTKSFTALISTFYGIGRFGVHDCSY
jgi:hypothetical protein